MRYDQLPHHEHPLRRGRAAMSRRAFLARASVFTVGTVATTGLLHTAASAASHGAEGATDSGRSPDIGLAVPIPYGNDFLGNGMWITALGERSTRSATPTCPISMTSAMQLPEVAPPRPAWSPFG